MGKKVLLVGEPMGLFIAEQEGRLDQVEHYTLSIAGAEYNVAVGMSRLGHQVSYLTKLGQDPFGKRIAEQMSKNGIQTEQILWSNKYKTGMMMKNKVSQGDPEICYFRAGSAASTLSMAEVDAVDFAEYSHLHMTGIFPALSASCQQAAKQLLTRAKEAGLFCSFDPNLRPSLWGTQEVMIKTVNEFAALADLVLPGVGEGELLTGSSEPEQIANFYHQLGVGAVVVKLGAGGAFWSQNGMQQTVFGFPVEQIVDTVGAGDGFAVGVISALMEQHSLAEAAVRGNAIGAIQVMSQGDNEGLPHRSQLEQFLRTGRKDWE